MRLLRSSTMIRLFNQSIGRLRLTKTKSLIPASLLVGALVTLLSAPLQAAGPSKLPADTFVILLSGPYEPVVRCPDLGLFQVNLCDGSYSTTKIYPVSGLPEENRGQGKIGNFYVAIGKGSPVAYDLPGGALTMVFTGNVVQRVPDGEGGTYIVGTYDLDIREATGIYDSPGQSFVGGHNKMVDILHRLADGTFVEHCICIISRPLPL
jgi:hypothetical protein